VPELGLREAVEVEGRNQVFAGRRRTRLEEAALARAARSNGVGWRGRDEGDGRDCVDRIGVGGGLFGGGQVCEVGVRAKRGRQGGAGGEALGAGRAEAGWPFVVDGFVLDGAEDAVGGGGAGRTSLAGVGGGEKRPHI